tara:strand:- start:6 stop:197 length:192 start_codon:yes stop_codon:yes gene_type:complete
MSNVSRDLANDKLSVLLVEYENVVNSMIHIRMSQLDETEDTATRRVREYLSEMDINQAKQLLR